MAVPWTPIDAIAGPLRSAHARPLGAKIATALLLGGVEEHDDEMRAGLQATLERLKAVAEAG
jgi:hypothetical protein